MDIKNIKRAVLVGFISGLYLIALFIFVNLNPNSNLGDNLKVKIMSIYYIFNCFLLLLIYFLLIKNKIKIAKFFAIFLVFYMLFSLFWQSGTEGNTFSFSLSLINQSVFIYSIIHGILSGLFIYFLILKGGISIVFAILISLLGIIPNILFFWGIFRAISLIFKKSKPEYALNYKSTTDIN